MLLTHSSTDCKMPVRLSENDSLNYICHVILLAIYFNKDKKRVELADIRASVDTHLKKNVEGFSCCRYLAFSAYDLAYLDWPWRLLKSAIIAADSGIRIYTVSYI
jgi:hypothetical protein